MIDWKNPLLNPKTPIECMSCRRFFVYHEDRYHPEYSAEDFDAHYLRCSFCQKWVRDYNSDPNSVHNVFRPIDLWNSNPKQEEEMSELDKMLRRAMRDDK